MYGKQQFVNRLPLTVLFKCVCVCVCVCVREACVRACVRVCVCVSLMRQLPFCFKFVVVVTVTYALQDLQRCNRAQFLTGRRRCNNSKGIGVFRLKGPSRGLVVACVLNVSLLRLSCHPSLFRNRVVGRRSVYRQIYSIATLTA